MAEASRQQVLVSVKSFFSANEYSDLIITCGNDSYNVHKLVVCTRVDFFAHAVKFGGKEASDNKINLPEDDPAIVKLLIQYLYEGDYEPKLPANASASEVATGGRLGFDIFRTETLSKDYKEEYTYSFPHSCKLARGPCTAYCVCPHHICSIDCNNNCKRFVCNKCTRPKIAGAASHLMIHAKMYEAADKYDVVGLKDLATEKFKYGCTVFWDDDAFPAAAHPTLSTTMEEDKGLRDVVSSTIADRIEVLVNKAEIQALMSEHTGLAFDIVHKGVDRRGWGKK